MATAQDILNNLPSMNSTRLFLLYFIGIVMSLTIVRRARGNPFARFLLMCFFVAFLAYYKPIQMFHLSRISREPHQYLNNTKDLPRIGYTGQTPVQLSDKEPQLSCPEVACPPPKLSVDPQTCNYPSISVPTSASKAQPSKLTIEQETIARLRAEGIVIIFKTGAQEVSQLSIHLGTTLRYLSASDILFFSDLQGSIGPFIINDALRNVDQQIRDSNPDFEIYRKIHEYLATGQDILDLKEDKSLGDDRGGWKLDKYKFIHMVEETFEMRPDAKWYVFIETDSYIVWPNLVAWLEKLDSKKPWYMGSAVSTGTHSFAHGGSGYVLSNAAMNRLLGPDQPQGLARSWDTRMTTHCCGDIALGIALEEKGVKLTGARPYMNGYKPSTFTYGEHWCQPVVAMHHMTSHEISSMWRLERKREVLGMANATTFSELYEQFVEPHLVEEKDNWDNLSHGQEYKAPEGWSGDVGQEELKREEEQRLGEESEKPTAQEMDEKKPDEERQLDSDTQRGTENQEDDSKEDVKQEPAEHWDEGNGDDEMKNKDHGEGDVGTESAIEKPFIDFDTDKDSVDSKEDTSKDYKDQNTANGEGKVMELRAKDDTSQEDVSDDARARSEVREKQLKELLKLKEKIKNMKGRKNTADTEQLGDGDIKQSESPSESGSSKDSPDYTRAGAEDMNQFDLSPDAESEKSSQPSLKRLIKRQDSLEEASPEFNTHPKWRPFSPENEAFKSFANCRQACEADNECFQFVFFDRTCKLSTSFRLGAYKAPELDVADERGVKRDIVFKSGWMLERIRSWTEKNACKVPEWLVVEY